MDAGRKVFTRPALEDMVGKVIGKQTETQVFSGGGLERPF